MSAWLPLPRLSWRALASWLVRRLKRVRVAGDSMLPTLSAGDEVLVDTRRRALQQVRVGEIVVVADPRETQRELVKRVVAIDDQGRVCVRGDNAKQSTDSRDFGPVPRELFVGRVVCKFG